MYLMIYIFYTRVQKRSLSPCLSYSVLNGLLMRFEWVSPVRIYCTDEVWAGFSSMNILLIRFELVSPVRIYYWWGLSRFLQYGYTTDEIWTGFSSTDILLMRFQLVSPVWIYLILMRFELVSLVWIYYWWGLNWFLQYEYLVYSFILMRFKWGYLVWINYWWGLSWFLQYGHNCRWGVEYWQELKLTFFQEELDTEKERLVYEAL